MTINQEGWLVEARHCPSPNFDHRPQETRVSLLVVHNISLPPGQFGNEYIEAFFTNQLDPKQHPFFDVIKDMKVSAHCLIKRTGEIVQFVSFNDRAWHAGQSSFAGVERCNDYSIGIELEGTDYVAYTAEQYQSLSDLSCQIMLTYPQINLNRITGHQFIAPLRKTDPGLSFDWKHYFAQIST
ncbi:1,6-anhydro-N-acetylmuramyl-L-alanine amidase AmpD [Vibrio maerlii]|uniref:1,6-anhydro-N-acetylmuramyl-L-alanine amidase AmpD n=1 Tax=Vibrio maerlii TaxID=2231648 RepID=UPI000E3C3A90|nr:1,6-anhydro-N-acetylmuramyl-L-alanine amidase AmpD [Vibrio maerlii]